MGKMQDKVVLITGAGSGFGRVTSKLFGSEGARVVVADWDEPGAVATVAEIREAGGEAASVRADVSKADDVETMVKFAVQTFGRLDVLFNNAGVQGDADRDVAHMPEAEFDRYIAIDLKGVWLGCHFGAPELVKTKGCIINTASVAAYIGNYGCSNYGPAKAGVRNLTAVVANELGRFGVRCNSISPYVAFTPGNAIPDQERALVEAGNPLGTLIDPMDIARTVLFLAGDDARCITGTDILIDAGHVTQAQPRVMDTFLALNTYPL